ncbi:hypothetical protein PDJAM_G00074220 [Pangasius djambal]|uniref:Uncharacterized protein n=1 Tax=Pangasius djambal TaxID=1691987 RepID=A0ACC5Z1I1_9TELE|nr:hypothetical protein [Pangasius djambal]
MIFLILTLYSSRAKLILSNEPRCTWARPKKKKKKQFSRPITHQQLLLNVFIYLCSSERLNTYRLQMNRLQFITKIKHTFYHMYTKVCINIHPP